MVRSRSVRAVANLGIASALTIFLGACGSLGLTSPTQTAAPEPGVAPEMPASIRAEEIVGRWGLASFQDPKDRARTELAAKGQCKQPYVIGAGSSGGVIMHLADRRRRRNCASRAARAARTISDHPDRPAASRTARSFRSTDASWSRASSTRTPRPATATWSMSAAGRAPRAFSNEVGTGSRWEHASKLKVRARF
jgi:hypothetical protein